MNRKFLLLILSLSILASCAEFDVDSIQNAEDFDEYLQYEMATQNIPALSVLIFKGSDVLLERYAGKSNIAQDLPLRPDHIFLLASISKLVTATALLQLYEDNLIDLDEAINPYLPFDVFIPGYADNITFRMLLTHSSSIRDGDALDDQYYFGQDPEESLAYFLENYLIPGGAYYHSSKNFSSQPPGSQYKYSNVGNALVGLLVEEISGQDFNTYCKENIFAPLGMSKTFWRLDEAIANDVTIVRPYEFNSGQYTAFEHYTFTDYPNGGLRSNARDLHAFITALFDRDSPGETASLNTSTINEIFQLQIPHLDDRQGLQFFLVNKRLGLWGHDGGEAGVSTVLAFNPDNQVGAIILANESYAEWNEILKQAYRLGLMLGT